jgi:hypothetical protein
LWVNFTAQRSEFLRCLNKFQAGDRSSSNFSIADIDHIFNKLSGHNFDSEFTTKLVIQTANFNVSPQTVANGCTTRLLFFLKVQESWFFYGHAKGRFNNWNLFNIKSGEKLGYSIFLSIGEQDREISNGVPDNMAIARLLERIRHKNQS